jgi:TRAP-type C4-dicarboxylate transport system permease small subunit
MSTSILTSISSQTAPRPGRGHRLRITFTAILIIAATATLLWYGLDYYLTSPLDRPYHPRHATLRPSGQIGLSLGIFGFFLFCLIFLYPLRKKWKWLASIGDTRHWFDFHILMGLTAPVVIAFHASFKFHGLAGMAYWIMFAVAASGIAGRYIFSQIPRSRNSAEMSLQESKQLQDMLMAKLAAQNLVKPADLARLFRLPPASVVEQKALLPALLTLLWIDVRRPFQVARLRRQALGFGGKITTLAGFLASHKWQLERTIDVAREQAALSKKLLFLAKSHKVFHLWHVVHRPFSYSFAVLALAHVVIATLFRFR